MPERREETAGYAGHEPKAAMGSQYEAGIGALYAEAATQAAHTADHTERMADLAGKFPGIMDSLDERSDFTLKGHLAALGKTKEQLIEEAEAAKTLAAKGGPRAVAVRDTPAAPGKLGSARIEYPCGCVATHPDPNFELPTECPTHVVPEPPVAPIEEVIA